MAFLGYFLLLLGMVAGLIMIPFGLPGVGFILVSTVIYSLATRFSAAVSFNLLIFFCVLTLIAETADNWLMALGARKYGASREAVWLSFAGAILGTLILGPLLALVMGVLGPFVGAFAGSFLTVFLYEYVRRKQIKEALRAGWGTVLGRTAGIVLKMAIGVSMVITVILKIIF
jgi:uncharacterized protein YqgC (DUF456 family)